MSDPSHSYFITFWLLWSKQTQMGKKKDIFFFLLLQVRVFRRRKHLVPAHAESLQQTQTLNPWTQSLCFNSALLHALKDWLYSIDSSYFSASRGNKLLFSPTADPWPKMSFQRELCEGGECNGIKPRVVLLWHRSHCCINPLFPFWVGWNGDFWCLVMMLFPWGKTISISGEIGNYIQARRQDVPGLAVRVRGYSILIITAAVTRDPESIWWSPKDKQWMHWHPEYLCWFQTFDFIWIIFSRFIFFQCSL